MLVRFSTLWVLTEYCAIASASNVSNVTPSLSQLVLGARNLSLSAPCKQSTRYPDLPEEAAVFARDDTGGMTLQEVVKEAKPTVLIGATAVPGLFSKQIVETMMENGVERPIIFPLSNPTSKAEITAVDAYTWTNGQAILASGSPFEPVEVNGVLHKTSQCNNVYVQRHSCQLYVAMTHYAQQSKRVLKLGALWLVTLQVHLSGSWPRCCSQRVQICF